MTTRRTGHPDKRRIADVRAGGRQGSGYLVDEDTVLTAGHLVRGASDIVTCFLGARAGASWQASAAIVWLDVDADLAVLRLTAGHGQSFVQPVRYGRLGDPPRTLTVQIAGCGQGTALLPRGTGALDIVVAGDALTPVAADATAPATDAAPVVLPGTAVFADGLVIGIVTDPPTLDDPGRLLAARLDLRFEHTRQGRLLSDLLAAGPLALAS